MRILLDVNTPDGTRRWGGCGRRTDLLAHFFMGSSHGDRPGPGFPAVDEAMDAKGDTAVVAPSPGVFDNRSISLPTDFPSANLLLSRGIRRIVLIQSRHSEPQADLSHSLLRWQQAGLTILAAAIDEPDPPRPITIKRPRAYRLLWYHLLAKLGLRSNPLGGIGGFLPMPSTG